MRTEGHVALWGRGEMYTEVWLGNQREIDHLEDPGVNGRIIILTLVPRIQINCKNKKMGG
jgi:hypothetical protein